MPRTAPIAMPKWLKIALGVIAVVGGAMLFNGLVIEGPRDTPGPPEDTGREARRYAMMTAFLKRKPEVVLQVAAGGAEERYTSRIITREGDVAEGEIVELRFVAEGPLFVYVVHLDPAGQGMVLAGTGAPFEGSRFVDDNLGSPLRLVLSDKPGLHRFVALGTVCDLSDEEAVLLAKGEALPSAAELPAGHPFKKPELSRREIAVTAR